ncbi:MAG: hypothetical protein PHE16_04625, partial [Aliarcobacter sp.]|nr:hypothetical protein [Aliarcobacter sp.]
QPYMRIIKISWLSLRCARWPNHYASAGQVSMRAVAKSFASQHLTDKMKASQNKNDLTYLILLFLFEFDMNLVSNIVKMLDLYKIP